MQKTAAVVNLNNLVYNARFVRKIIGDKAFYAVVKADAYGHGGAEVALALQNLVQGFCVAITDEGAALRLAGVTKPVLVLTPPLGEDDVLRAEFYGLTLSVNSLYTAKLVKGLPCHIKVNTGMNRFGCGLKELKKILQVLPPESVLGVYSHLYDPADPSACTKQLQIFKSAESEVKGVNPSALAHLAASGGVLAYNSGLPAAQELLKDGVRCGILLYGYAPAGFSAEVKPVLKVYARKAQTSPFIGGGIGYEKAQKNYKNLSVYRLGYADGFSRASGLGESPLCMDSFLSEDDKNYKLVFSDAAEYAAKLGSIPYEALCSVTKRAQRFYVYE